MSIAQVIENIERETFQRATQRQERLIEHRCPCGRLLGKFAGQAEVKCPKCGKVNVIGGELDADSGIAR